MTIEITYIGDTRNYVKYETSDMDFSRGGIKAKFWIPKGDIETNIPGVYPEKIKVKVIDNSNDSNGGFDGVTKI